jgi:hypothetical protein
VLGEQVQLRAPDAEELDLYVADIGDGMASITGGPKR